MLRLVLNTQDFKKLIAGEVLKKDGAEIILEDIGFEQMIHYIKLEAMDRGILEIPITRKV